MYITDTGLLCALLGIRNEDDLHRSPAIGSLWETFVFKQLRHREHLAGRTRSLSFWRDRTREVDFVVDAGGQLELYEAKWSELPGRSDAVNLAFAREVMRKSKIANTALICRAPNAFPLGDDLRAIPVDDL